MNLNLGDTVILKSGGPIMTIEEVEQNQITCVWFDEKKELKRDVFKAEMLERE